MCCALAAGAAAINVRDTVKRNSSVWHDKCVSCAVAVRNVWHTCGTNEESVELSRLRAEGDKCRDGAVTVSVPPCRWCLGLVSLLDCQDKTAVRADWAVADR